MKAKSKLLLSACALSCSLAVASTGTFAWFSANSTPKVDTFDMNVMAGDGVQVALRTGGGAYAFNEADTNYGTPGISVSESAIKAAIGSSLKLGAVQSGDGEGFKKVTFADGDSAIEPAATAAVANTDYASFTLRFTTGKSGMKLKYAPTANSLLATSKSADFSQIAGVAFGSGAATDVVTASVQDVARVSMVAHTDTSASTSMTWTNPTESNRTDNGASGLAWAIYKHEAGLTKTDPTVTDGTDVIADADLKTGSTAVELGTFAQVGATSVYRLDVTVNVWLDGWDGDCFNSVMSQVFTVSLGFEGSST